MHSIIFSASKTAYFKWLTLILVVILLSASIGVDTLSMAMNLSTPATETSLIFGFPNGKYTKRVSIGNDGKQGKYGSYRPSLTYDGRFLAFESESWNMVSDHSIDYKSIFVRDMQTGQNFLISIANDGSPANGISEFPSISSDGRFVAFRSKASNLVDGDTNDEADIFLHDRLYGTTELVSVGIDGAPANGRSVRTSISSDGRYVAFDSHASNLVENDTNGEQDIFVYDSNTKLTKRVTVSSQGNQSNYSTWAHSISGDGRYVTFSSFASNLVSGDMNNHTDVFVHDQQTGVTELISVAGDGTQGNDTSGYPTISFDGRYVAYQSEASNLVENDTNICGSRSCKDAFVHDRQSGVTERVSISSDGSEGNGDSGSATISGDGQYVVFTSQATNLIPEDINKIYDLFIHDRNSGLTEIISVSTAGSQGNWYSYEPSLSSDGQLVVFTSQATNLAPDDTNGYPDVYLRDREREEVLSFAPVIGTCTPLFFDNFNDPNSGWPTRDDDYYLVEYVQGEYKVFLMDWGLMLYAHPGIKKENYAVNVEVRKEAGTNGSQGLIFGLSEESFEFYSFEVSIDGSYGIYRYYDGIWTTLKQEQSPHVNTGTSVNHLEIIRNGENIIAFVNGAQVASLKDPTYLGSRYVGIIARKDDLYNHDLRFDNFRINHLNCVGLFEHASLDEGRK